MDVVLNCAKRTDHLIAFYYILSLLYTLAILNEKPKKL